MAVSKLSNQASVKGIDDSDVVKDTDFMNSLYLSIRAVVKIWFNTEGSQDSRDR